MRMVADVEEEVGDAIEGTAARAQTACEAAGAGLRGRCGGGGFNIIAMRRLMMMMMILHHRAVAGGRVFEFRAELL